MKLIGTGQTDDALTDQQVRQIVADAAGLINPAGKKILVLIPDYTRTCPLPLISRALHTQLAGQAEKLDFLIALGTHPPMSQPQIEKLLGVDPGRLESTFPGSKVYNHAWKDPDTLATIGTLIAAQIDEITGGLFSMDIDVTINKMIFDYDLVLVAGPVFPHEVVGFSGGAKYFFPGICGQELLDFFHWLGAVITNPRIIGTKHTPVRATLHAALDLIDVDTAALSMVVKGDQLNGLYFGSVKESWSAAADLSDKLHITYCNKTYTSVLSRAPEMYDELWVGGKCMYKLEPVVADGGELIIYAPHIEEISVVHGELIREIGYHTRDYFLNQWERFKNYPWGIVAHSTHVRGIGTFENGVEKGRIDVVLATGIDKETCHAIGLGYRDPDTIDPRQWQDDDDKLYIPKAGEMLYKLKNPPAWARFE
ncbi:MAG: lactate racemase domain-containing protein [Phycisphaerae bacterium]